jgi:hypothetical protein
MLGDRVQVQVHIGVNASFRIFFFLFVLGYQRYNRSDRN